MPLSLFNKGYKLVPFILVFDLFSFYTKIQTICKLKTGKNERIDPIRDPQKIREIKQKLRTNSSSDYLLFTIVISRRRHQGIFK